MRPFNQFSWKFFKFLEFMQNGRNSYSIGHSWISNFAAFHQNSSFSRISRHSFKSRILGSVGRLFSTLTGLRVSKDSASSETCFKFHNFHSNQAPNLAPLIHVSINSLPKESNKTTHKPGLRYQESRSIDPKFPDPQCYVLKSNPANTKQAAFKHLPLVLSQTTTPTHQLRIRRNHCRALCDHSAFIEIRIYTKTCVWLSGVVIETVCSH